MLKAVCSISFSRLIDAAVCICLLVISKSTLAEYSFETEWDPYYSNLGYYQSLTDRPIPEVVEDDETTIYNRMLDSAFSVPRFMLLELGVYPLPYLGAYIREQHTSAYEKLSIGDFNLIRSITAGYDEPYALSLFFGSIVRFVKKGEEQKAKNKGYTGFLFSAGDQHIVRNSLVNDNWYELEWKIKGDQDFENKTLSWSLRFGGKVHDNPDITDVIYFGLRRNHLDTASDDISWFQNADIDFKLDLDKNNFELSQLSLFVNKKWPAPFFKKSTFEFGVGIIRQVRKYVGALESESDDFQLVLRPSFKF